MLDEDWGLLHMIDDWPPLNFPFRAFLTREKKDREGASVEDRRMRGKRDRWLAMEGSSDRGRWPLAMDEGSDGCW